MRIKRLIVTCAAVGAVAAGGAATANAAAPSKRCYPARTRTSLQNEQVRIFTRGRDDDAVDYACNLRSGSVTELGPISPLGSTTEYVDYEAVAGRFVAFDDAQCSHAEGDCAGSRIVVLDSKTGKTRRGPSTVPGSQGLVAVVVRSNGTAAYVTAGPGIYELHRFAGGVDTILDSGPGIDPRSLAVGGARLYWLKDGVAQTTLI